MLVANKKQALLKSYSLEIRIDSVNQNKIPCVYIHVYQIRKNWGPGPYNSLRHADSRRYFSGLSLTQNRREAHIIYLAREMGKFGHVLAKKKVTL